MLDFVNNSDASNWIKIDGYIQAFMNSGDTAGPNVIAGYQEGMYHGDFAYGNVLQNGSAAYSIHYNGDNTDEPTDAMTNRNGLLQFYSNTVDSTGIAFDTMNNAGLSPILTPAINSVNNIFWGNSGFKFGRNEFLIMSSTTNLMKAGTFSIATPITAGNLGWPSGCEGACSWMLTSPLDTHLYGVTNANFLSTVTQPYDSTTFAATGAAVNAGTALTGLQAQNPVRFQWNTATNSLSPRTQALTVGAVDGAIVTNVLHFYQGGGSQGGVVRPDH